MTDHVLIPLPKVKELLHSVEIHGKLVTGILNDLKAPAKRKERKRKHERKWVIGLTFFGTLPYICKTSEVFDQGRKSNFQNQEESHQKTHHQSLHCRTRFRIRRHKKLFRRNKIRVKTKTRTSHLRVRIRTQWRRKLLIYMTFIQTSITHMGLLVLCETLKRH